MKKLSKTLITVIALCVIAMGFGCNKSSVTPHKTTDTTAAKTQILYSMDDTLETTSTTIWSVATDGTGNKKVAISVPTNLHFDFDSDIAAEVSTDNKTMTLSLDNADESNTYFYKCNIDGSNVQAIPNIDGYIYLQTFISPTAILYWQNANNDHNGELWQTNTDGSSNQQVNIALPTGVYFGDGKFAKVSADGKTMIFSTFGTTNSGSTSAIYKCNTDGSGLTLVTSDNTSGTLQAIINTNTLLYNLYNATTNEDELWLVNLDGSNKHQISLTLPTGLTLADSRAEATSSTIYFVTGDANDTQAIYSAGIDGTNVKLVANVPLGYAVKLQGLIK